MNKICVYTCITGNYDSLKDIEYKETNIDYICFTNNKNIKSNSWKVVYIDEELDNLLLARKVKVLGYKYLNKYDVTIWLDGAIKMNKKISTFLDKECELDKYDMVGFNHQFRHSIYEEINECVQVHKETQKRALTLEKFLKKEKYKGDNGLIESGILVRKNTSSVNKLMDNWYYMIENYSKRDQLTFNYCLWKYPVNIKFIDKYIYNNDYFIIDSHKDNEKTKNYRIAFNDLDIFDYHNIIDGVYKNQELKEGINIKVPIDTDVITITLDEVGNIIKSVKVNKKNVNKTIYNICNVNNSCLFYDLPVIKLTGKFKKNDLLTINIDIEEKTLKDDLNTLFKLNNDYKITTNELNEYKVREKELIKANDDLNNVNNKLISDINNILNSTSWKITKPLRRIIKLIKRGK